MELVPISEEEMSLEKLDDMKNLIAELPNQLTLPVTHHHVQPSKDGVTGGIYAREMFIPAGTVVVGAIHKYPHLNVMLKGVIDIAMPEGVFRLSAPQTFTSEPGAQRVVYAIEDTIWLTIHSIHEMDEEVIWNTVICEDINKYKQYSQLEDNECHMQ